MSDKEIKLECIKIAQKYAFDEKAILELAARLFEFIKS
jgi:hypothetical protein